MARKVYRVVPKSGDWDVTHKGQVLSHHLLKSNAVEAGTKVAKAHLPSQLVIHRENGTIEKEYTYGAAQGLTSPTTRTTPLAPAWSLSFCKLTAPRKARLDLEVLDPLISKIQQVLNAWIGA
ncbi:DUF2188 domain-containing protein [Actinophytocola sp.]|jgi:hypothetical protein|uniref:DUF2188 domain-containing protein n=1 Tax=Actinophytocola sp. TaxID=1872138 RepID=UPI002ED894CD